MAFNVDWELSMNDCWLCLLGQRTEFSCFHSLFSEHFFVFIFLKLQGHSNYLALPELCFQSQYYLFGHHEDVSSNEDSNESQHGAADCCLQVQVAVWHRCIVWNPVRKDQQIVCSEPSEELVDYLLLIELVVFEGPHLDSVDQRGERSHDLNTDLEQPVVSQLD